MGSEQSYGHNPTTHSKRLESHEEYEIYESQSTEEYEKYQVFHDGSEDFEKNYQFRVENKHNDLVDVVYAGPTHGFIGCTDRGKYEVITERIPQRLGTMKSIDSKHALAVLKTALRGFRDLYRKHGIFGIKESMIGINKRNKVKVWINHNFAVNRPEETPSSYLQLSVRDQEREMVQNIIDLVDLRAEHGQLWREMIHLKQMRNPCTFDEALNLVDYFCGANQLNLIDQIKNGANKRQKKVELGVQPHAMEEKIFRTNGSVPSQHFPVHVPLSRDTLNNNIAFQSQNRPVPINNSQLLNSNFPPLRPPSAHFTFTVPKQQPIQVPVAQFERNHINFMSQRGTNQSPQQNHDRLPEKNDKFKQVEDIATKGSLYKIETQVPTFTNIQPTQVNAQSQVIGSYSFNKVNQQIGQSTQNIYLRQPQIQVHINQIASQQSSSQHSPSVLKSNHDLDNCQLNYPERKIVFCFEKTNATNNLAELGPFQPYHTGIAKETNIIQLTLQGQASNKKSSTPHQNSISYKEMRRLLMEQLQS